MKNYGTLLKFADDEKKWDTVLNKDMCELPENKNEILPNIRMSYHELPSHLKLASVFAQCFPRSTFLKRKHCSCNGLQRALFSLMEDIGDTYFFELLSKSFFQYSHANPSDGLSRYKMQSLVHDYDMSCMPHA